ncbi:DUF5313 domain-containing protein [Actinomadura madurae]|uniref:DUF5313 family protein n=1 Tax=Actinomadura madurae TaxID=1993 RepID=UPI0020D22200|nr:DUF5313 family protein [Actinomadura madurae]MCP9967428.1 DUF5313 domain-containing protein [Actinomadura madurae]
MARLPGDPGPLRRARYALGFRLPPGDLDWVRHDLTDAGWRGRLLLRHLYVMAPVCLLLALLPGPVWVRVAVPCSRSPPARSPSRSARTTCAGPACTATACRRPAGRGQPRGGGRRAAGRCGPGPSRR